ncbi:MAG: cobalamin-dependent protein [Candidatus Eremiobacteraeota bacterium]|nr:cobalamin-dependent protein [Candidatus Eremiobacteraeota bacterium]MCW5868797.1 cobalamin-dependent protein [Candidatus Eremiobacteraeota bacterium]
MKHQLDAVLIHPGNSHRIYQALANELSAIEPPVWASLMASYLRTHGHSVTIIDADAESLTATQVAERVSDLRPRLAVLVVYGHQPSASTQNMGECGRIATCLKQLAPTVPVLMAGGHVAALPERTLNEEKTDYVSTGEGLTTAEDLLQAFKAGSPPDLSRVRGLGYRREGKVCFTPAAPLVTGLEESMPMQAWDLLDMSRYRAHNWHCFGESSRQPYASIYTSLGCPYHCSFCCIQAPFKSGEQALGMKTGVNSYRSWSPAKVVDQLEHLATTYGVRNVKFADEMFVLHRQQVLGICDEILRRGLSFNIWAYARVDTIKEDMLEKLQSAGFRWLALGIESGSQRVRKAVGKGISPERLTTTVDMVQKAGIHIIANYIFGLPEDDFQSMQETLDLSLALNCAFANFYSSMAYPGSALYQEALREGLPLPTTWEGFSQHAIDSLPLRTKYLSGPEVLAFRDDAFHRYYGDPHYLATLESRFGPEVRAQTEKMAATRLQRNYLPALKESP